MSIFSTSATVDEQGKLQLGGVPFAPGTQVDVTVSPARRSSAEFGVAWKRLCAELRGQQQLASVTDQDITDEIRRYRKGQ